MACARPRTAMRKLGNGTAPAVSELLLGEEFDLFEFAGDWAFGRSTADQYIGWVAVAALEPAGVSHETATSITAASAPLFSEPDIKATVLADLPFGARLSGTHGTQFLAVARGGFVHNRHLTPLGDTDPLAIARRFTGAPYLWGGRTPAGVDCSGLVQAALGACGIAAPRDSDQQRDTLGTPIAFNDRQAGDLVFFPGHVGILASRDRLFHANAHWMATLEEPLADVIARLQAAGVTSPVSGVKRVQRVR